MAHPLAPHPTGKFFTFDLLDNLGGEIRCLAFNNEADRFEAVVEVGAILQVSKASLKPKRNNVRPNRSQRHLSDTGGVLKYMPARVPRSQTHPCHGTALTTIRHITCLNLRWFLFLLILLFPQCNDGVHCSVRRASTTCGTSLRSS